MAKLKFNADDAVAAIKLLISEVKNLKTSMSSINQANVASFNELSTGLKKLKGNFVSIKNEVNSLKSQLKTVGDSTNSSTGAFDKLTKKVKDAKNAFLDLKTAGKENTNEGARAKATYLALEGRLKAIKVATSQLTNTQKAQNNQIQVTLTAYEVLKEKQQNAKIAVQEYVAAGNIEKTQLQQKQQLYQELTAKLELIQQSTKSLKQLNLEKIATDKKEADAIDKAVAAANKKEEAEKRAIASAEKLAKQNEHLNRSFVKLVAKQTEAKNALRDAIAGGKASRSEIKRLQREYDKLTKKVDKASASTRSFTKAGKGIKAIGRTVRNLASAFGLILGVQLIANFSKQVFELAKTFDGLAFALERVTGNAFDAASSQRFLLDLTTRFGVELVSTTNRWIKFLAAAKQSGLTTKQTEDIFRSMTKTAAVLGLKTSELTGIYLALEQMLSKGKVTTEELRRQLGERLPGAMGIMAAAIGVTIPELDKMLKKGEVLSADVLPKFAKAVELAFDIRNVDNVDTLVAAQGKLVAAWQVFIKKITEADSVIQKFFKGALAAAGGLVQFLDETFSTTAQNIDDLAGEREISFKVFLKDKAIEEIERALDDKGLIARLEQEATDTLEKYNNFAKDLTVKTNKDEKEALKLHHETLIEQLTKYAIQADKLQ